MSQATLVAGRYQLGPSLGRGGMADVHAGHDVRLGREVAIKVLRADLARDPSFRLRFEREAQNVASLNHPGIVAVYDTGEVAAEGIGLPYIVMEYVSGSTLRDLLRAHGPMPPERACAVTADVCAALGFSHEHGVVHRDVKPANIMITPGDVVKVMDFGIARALTETGPALTGDMVIGTAQYLSPEQGLGQEVDARADVYAAGCVLFELLTGEPPFTGDSPVAIVYQHVREDPPLVATLAPSGTDIPTELEAVVRRAMAKNPDNRYETAADMRADLLRVLAGERPDAPAVLAEHERLSGGDSGGGTDPGRRRARGGRAGAHEDTAETVLTPELARGGHRGTRTGAHAAAGSSRRRGRLVAVVALLVVLLGGAGWWALGPSDSEVPRLVGLTRGEAERTLADAGLAAIVVPTASPPEQVDRVVAVTPDVGARVEEASPVTLRVGRGPGLVQVPLLVGRSPEAARVAAEGAGLVLTPVPRLRETDDPTEVGQVVGQDPVPGSLRPAGGAIELTIGQRRATLQVPDVVGRSQASAEATLEGVGLEVSVREVDGGGAAGTVVALTPGVGTAVPRGSTVTLDVARAGSSSGSGDGSGEGVDGSGTGDAEGGAAGDTGAGETGDTADDTGAGQDDGFFDDLFG
ncbi:Stk1 family PASTA domain-containing Ser/Thr kinase [Actinomycetospora straminea]|uniref:non-specific serine/threonine protein kinase n=1 Tax=Actinomycetospora straminea TaxID=663607 RepID=A0ABP9DYQ1_9PSEU|nr:Stk1 family PASTA domain-containing Ser/Thr kinase [Actinomycetospora straminea]MDD7930963.1 Stk1 family PASTA domain-containing Ser/Thr kinase [Actinomycetospora straminea]